MAKRPKRRKILVRVMYEVAVDLDESLLPDDEWREQFYRIHTLDELAEHFAFNRIVNGVDKISRLDGFADRDDSLCRMSVGEIETDVF